MGQSYWILGLQLRMESEPYAVQHAHDNSMSTRPTYAARKRRIEEMRTGIQDLHAWSSRNDYLAAATPPASRKHEWINLFLFYLIRYEPLPDSL